MLMFDIYVVIAICKDKRGFEDEIQYNHSELTFITEHEGESNLSVNLLQILAPNYSNCRRNGQKL